MPNHDVVLVAVFTPNQPVFSLSFYIDNDLYLVLEYKESELVSVPEDPNKDGYTFVGWSFNDVLIDDTFTMPNHDVVLVAVFTPSLCLDCIMLSNICICDTLKVFNVQFINLVLALEKNGYNVLILDGFSNFLATKEIFNYETMMPETSYFWFYTLLNDSILQPFELFQIDNFYGYLLNINNQFVIKYWGDVSAIYLTSVNFDLNFGDLPIVDDSILLNIKNLGFNNFDFTNYYGTFDGYSVFFKFGNAFAVWRYEVAGFLFFATNISSILVWNGYEFVTLKYLFLNNIFCFHIIHTIFYWHMNWLLSNY